MRRSRAFLLSLAILLGGLGITLGAVRGAQNALDAETQARFTNQANQLQGDLRHRINSAEQILKDTAATFLASDDITAAEFHRYARARELGEYFEGLRAIGMVELRAAAALPSADASGAPLLVRYLEPAQPGARLMAADIAADAAWLAAAQRAISTARTTLSAPVALAAQGPQPGWVMMLPDPAAPRSRLFFLVLSIEDLLDELRPVAGRGLMFQLLDGVGKGKLLYDSRDRADGPLPRAPHYSEQSMILANRMITWRVVGTRALTVAPGQSLPWVVGASGVGLSLLLALATWLLMSSQERARRIAASMTADLRRMARVVERTSSAVFGMDLDGRITWANAGFERLTGLDADEAAGRLAAELPEIAGFEEASRRQLRQAIARREGRRLELQNQMRDGVRYWTDTELQTTRDSEGQINGFIGIATDITRRKLADLRLRDNEHLMRVIADNLPARVSYWDRQRRCRFVNRRFCEEFGGQPQDWRGRLLSPEVLGQGHYERLLAQVDAVLQGEPQYLESQETDARGRATAWQLHYMPDVEDGQVLGFFILGLDVTELRQARDLAVQANQAKSRFLSSMSHEIRTPLNAVLGMLALLRGTALDTRQRDYAAKAEGAARSLLTLLNDILDLAKIEAGKMSLDPRPFALEDLLRDLSVIFAANVGSKPLELVFDLDPQLPPWLLGDDLRLRQILINLGGNAIKFTESGEVVVSLRLLAHEGRQLRLRVSVRDTGIGISPQERARIFSDFGQASDSTAREFGGTGLGLAICQKLLGLMGSQLQLDSEPGRGSSFWFELNLAEAEGGRPALPALPRPVRRVLVVDDNELARISLGAMAHSLDWVADLAASGEEALALMAQALREQPYDAVFIDWRMPGMDGLETCSRLRELPGGTEPPLVIMVTASGREALGQQPPNQQKLLDGYLVKPVTPGMLLEVLAGTQGPAAVPAPPAAPAALPLAGVRLLLVEDNPINQEVARELLLAQGAEVEVADDGEQGLARLRADADRYDAVLMDVLMPVMDGLTAARAVREQLGNWRLPIIAMTANAMESDRLESLAAGMNDHVGKPFAIDELVQVLLRHVRRPGAPASEAAPPGRPTAAAAAAGATASATVLAASASDSSMRPLLDRPSAIARLGNDEALYQRLVPSFRESLQGIAGRLPTLLHSVTQAEAVRLLHTLKGSASTMGAEPLSDAAAAAEKRLARPDGEDGNAEALQAVAQAIAQTLAALDDAQAAAG